MAIFSGLAFFAYLFLSSLVFIIWSLVKWKSWFNNKRARSTIILLFMSILVPIAVVYISSNPYETTGKQLSFLEGGQTLERLVTYRGGKPVSLTYRKRLEPNGPYLKDSTWVFFNRAGDTTRIEVYKLDSLILKKEF
ncbi:hypothetical protein [Aquimarina intermedia]|nr:hypothetical protein [Aquimarina intermedia]